MGAETDVVRDAAAMGFTLMQRELDTGQLAWVWLAPDARPEARFLTRPQALSYMMAKFGMTAKLGRLGS